MTGSSTQLRSISLSIAAACVGMSVAFVTHVGVYPQDYFSLPVNRQVQLSATFGALRTNHFHSGLDIKSKDGSVGEPVLAAAQGFISRVCVLESGYGNAVYIDHPNGYTTVYAHLDHFPPQVRDYVKSMQYTLESFVVDLSPKPSQFRYDKGDVIGYLGNSGGSTGPHLHFEIRETDGQVPINPLLFGLKVPDQTRPSIRALRVYTLDERFQQFDQSDYTPSSVGQGIFELKDTLIVPAKHAGFALKVYDQVASATNLTGIYALTMSVDGTQQYQFELERIPFSLTRYLNAHIDYAARAKDQGYYHRCFRLPGNALGIYTETQEGGIVQLNTQNARKIELQAVDFEGNSSSLVFYIRASGEYPAFSIPESSHEIVYGESATLITPDYTVSFEPHTFYQNTYVQIVAADQIRNGLFAPAYQLMPEDVPVHRYFDIRIKSADIPEGLQSKAFLARIGDRGQVINCGGTAHDNVVEGSVRTFGTYSVAVDTIAPDIVPITFRENMRGMSKMQFRIGDNQEVEGRARDLSYKGTVDGKWILMEMDAKRSRLTYWFDEHVPEGDHEFVLTVKDDRGNVNTFKRTFSR